MKTTPSESPARYLVSSLWSDELINYCTVMYAAGFPVISDAAFDNLEREFRGKKQETKTVGSAVSSTVGSAVGSAVGSKPSSALKKAKHAIPMGSLEKAQNKADIVNWIKGLGRNPWPLFISDKLDGISIDIEYSNGDIISAVTRGDGSHGEDITRNVMLMKGVKNRILGFTGHIRGEIIIKKSDFHNFPDASNTRNSAAGAAKSIHDNSKCKFCSVLFYRIIPYKDSKVAEFNALEFYGLESPVYHIANSVDDIFKIYNLYINSVRDEIDYDIDGLVIEINDTENAFSVGTNMLHPEYAIALKFPHAEGETTLRAVEIQVGNTGRITPVAVFDEVNLSGANICRASLATFGLMKSKNISIGARIVVSRRNDVIPMVERVISAGTHKVKIPTECPSCGSELFDEGEYVVCTNTATCPAQIQGSIINYTKKIGVLEWGDTIIEAICDSGIVDNLSDIYKLTVKDLASVTMIGSGRVLGEKNAQTMVDNLRNKSSLPLHVFVGSLGIKGIGRTMCRLIVDAGYDTIEEMKTASEYELASIQGFGPVRAREFVNGIQKMSGTIREILKHVRIEKPATGTLKGKSVCMTGFRDADMVTEIESKGGSIKSSVGAGLTYLVQKDRVSVSEKSKKALSLGVKVISVDDMWDILNK